MTRPLTRRAALGGAAAASAALTMGATAVPASAASRRALIGRARGADLHVMTFNVRYDNESASPESPDSWVGRAPVLARLLREEEPTLLGVQEAEYHQLAVVEDGLGKRHRMLGFGRDGGSRGEYSAVFYDADRLEALEWDQTWLSDTPRVIGSATWGNRVTRIVTWVRLRDRATGRELLHVNSHFDHESENARVRSAEVVRDLVTAVGLPAVVTADFNAAAARSAPYEVLTSGGLADTWATAATRLTPALGTFPNYGPTVVGGDRIDWVLASPDVVVAEAAINPYTRRDRYPSDHLPVQALVRL